MARDLSLLGNKLGPKLVKLVSDTVIATRKGLAHHEKNVRVHATQQVIDGLGHEVADLYRPIIQLLLEQDDGSLHPHVREFLETAASGHHQAKAAAGLLMGSVQGAISLIINNELSPLVYRLVAANPNLDLDPQTAATAVAQGITPYDNGRAAAADQGFDAGLFQTLSELAHQYPAITDAIDMYRRGAISGDELVKVIRRNGVPAELVKGWEALVGTPISPADAALALLRSNITRDKALQAAKAYGVNAEDFDVLVGNTGEPIALLQLLEAYRRDFIDQARLERGIKQSRIRDEWIDVALKLRYSPMSVADAVNAVVQSHLSFAEGEKRAKQNGLDPSEFKTLYETAGEPLSRTELEQLYNRGLVTKDAVKQGLRESRLKDKYVDDAFNLHTRLLEPRTISSAAEVGALTTAEGIKIALEYGFSQRDAQILVHEGSNRKLKTYRDAAVKAAEALYVDSLMSQDNLRRIAESAGHDADEARYIVQAAEFRRQAKIVSGVINGIRGKYISHHITEAEASHLLGQAQVPASNRDQLLSEWRVLWEANIRKLSEAQIVKAVKKKRFTIPEGIKRLEQLGYSASDATILIEDA